MHAEVLKSRPDILATVSEHLYGQLEGFVSLGDPAIAQRWEDKGSTMETREEQLGEFLSFVNSLSATHEVIRGVLASDVWFGTLLRIVDIDVTTGVCVCVCVFVFVCACMCVWKSHELINFLLQS